MFIGHHAIAFAAKRVSPATSLGSLFLAVQFLDQLWPVLLLFGIEHVRIAPGITVVSPLDLHDYPISHSLAAALVWSGALGALYFAVKKNRKGAIVVGLCVFSHWILDFITHRPDMPLGFGPGTYVGLGLWDSLVGTLIVELGFFIAGIAMYARFTEAKDKTGVFSLWGLVAFLLLMYFASLFGPPPPGETELAIGANAGWLLILWAYWIDRHRRAKSVESSPRTEAQAT